MAAKESRALRLRRKHSIEELEVMLHGVQADPDNQANGRNGLYLLMPKAMKLCEDITWAMYYHRRPKGNAVMRC